MGNDTSILGVVNTGLNVGKNVATVSGNQDQADAFSAGKTSIEVAMLPPFSLI